MTWNFYNAAGFLKTSTGRELVSTLPSSPVDGQEVFYQSSEMATDGLIWHLRYRSASSSPYKWEFLGGSDLGAYVATEESTALTSYTDLYTAGPSITLPLAGDYDVFLGVRGYNNTNGASGVMSFQIGAATALDTDSIDMYALSGAAGHIPTHSTVRRKTGLTAVTLTSKYKVSAGTAYFQKRFLRATPIRVG